MNINARYLFLTFLFILASVVPAGAQNTTWGTYQPNDAAVRPFHDLWTVTSVDCTTTTLNNGNADTIVAAFDISSDATTSVPSGDIYNTVLLFPRRLGVEFKEHSGSGLKGFIYVEGYDAANQYIADKMTTAGGVRYGLTDHAYSTITKITISLTGNAASDTLRIGPYGIGLTARCTTLQHQWNVSVASDAYTITTYTNSTGVWNALYGTWVPTSAYAVGNQLNFYGFSNGTSAAKGGLSTVVCTTGSFASNY